MQDLYGRVGVVQVHPVFEELFHAFDTRPPVQENGVRDEKNFSDCGNRFISIVTLTVLLSLVGTVAEATGLVDDTVEAGNLYSKYSLNNYQLDFFVDSSWDWLPWNWGWLREKRDVWSLCHYQFYLDSKSVFIKRHGLCGSRSLQVGFHFGYG